VIFKHPHELLLYLGVRDLYRQRFKFRNCHCSSHFW
jgi:hypothetical protein